jgi:O-antigen ligase
MQLTTTWRVRLYGTAAAILGIILAVEIAHEQYAWPVICLGVLAAIALISAQPRPISAVLLGTALVGYVVGNRGFAQLSLTSQLPLLPGEFLLLVVGGIMLVGCALQRELPFRRDALNYAILGWMFCGSVRLYVDLRSSGISALRDHATIYYAAFFFLAQWAARLPEGRRVLRRSLLGGIAALLVVFPLFTQFPEFFLSVLLVRGAPLVFFKGDLAGTFMAVGAILFFLRYEERRQHWALVLSLLLTALLVTTNNRASMLGLFVAMVLLAAAGRRRFALYQAAAGITAAVVILFVAHLRGQSWRQTPVYDMYERVVSIVDPQGHRAYSGETTFNKGDNNLFRTVWWRTCIDETLATNPWLGLGWGYDLAQPFVRVYYPETGEDFSTRSPHNILVTLFARAGIAGLLPFLAVLLIIAQRTWRALRAGAPYPAGLWCGAWVIICSACLGVVLEGPMGAVVFWIILGLAHAESSTESAAPEVAAALEPTEAALVSTDPSLPDRAPGPPVSASAST